MDYEALRGALDAEIRRWVPDLGRGKPTPATQLYRTVGWFSAKDLCRQTIHAAGFQVAQRILSVLRDGVQITAMEVTSYGALYYVHGFDVQLY
jgi:hypothetical protein